MIIREEMGLDEFSSELGELGRKGGLRKVLKKAAKPFRAVKKAVQRVHKTLKKKDPIRRLIKGKPKRRGAPAGPPEEVYEEVSVPEEGATAYDPGYVDMPGGSAPGYDAGYDPGEYGEEALGPAAPGSDMEVDPYADEGVEEEGEEDEGEEEAVPALPKAPEVPPPTTVAPTAVGEGVPVWVWVAGTLLVGGGIYWYLKKSGKI